MCIILRQAVFLKLGQIIVISLMHIVKKDAFILVYFTYRFIVFDIDLRLRIGSQFELYIDGVWS